MGGWDSARRATLRRVLKEVEEVRASVQFVLQNDADTPERVQRIFNLQAEALNVIEKVCREGIV